jgi:uncharacterized glyoxalase superfamily protein PhnB
MLSNRSVPPCTVIAVLRYPDPGVAAEWLSKVFGFTVRLRIANHRIQMNAGDGCFVIAEGEGAADNATSLMVRIEDAESHCERARSHGARILLEPTDHMYGERQYNVEDFAGHRWTFTQSIADVDPREWGGEPVNL